MDGHTTAHLLRVFKSFDNLFEELHCVNPSPVLLAVLLAILLAVLMAFLLALLFCCFSFFGASFFARFSINRVISMLFS